MLPHPFLQLQCCLQRSLEGGEGPGPGRTRCASSLPCPRCSCTASLDSASRAPPAALERSSPRCSPSTTSTPQRVVVPAPSSLPDCAGTPPTHTRTVDRVKVVTTILRCVRALPVQKDAGPVVGHEGHSQSPFECSHAQRVISTRETQVCQPKYGRHVQLFLLLP